MDEMSQVTTPAPTQSTSDFARLMDGLKDAVLTFQREATPENFAKIISALGAYGLTSARVWNDAIAYTKRHPVRTAMGAGLIFFALKGLASAQQTSSGLRGETYH